LLRLTTDGHKASRGLSPTAALLVSESYVVNAPLLRSHFRLSVCKTRVELL